VIVNNLGPDVVNGMVRIDLATVEEEPASEIDRFEFNQSQCGVASFTGSPPWEFHPEGDELLHILSGACHLTVRTENAEETRTLTTGDVAVVPRGCWHRNHSPDGVINLPIDQSDNSSCPIHNTLIVGRKNKCC
jgi:quercetin dioxygenase-like cupin family protein